MLSKLINLFYSQKEKDDNEEDILAAITYYIKPNSDRPSVDIQLKEYDQDCCDAMCRILKTMSSAGFYIETITILKNALLQEKREDILLYFLTQIEDQIKDDILQNHKDDIKDEPCVKPSDVLE